MAVVQPSNAAASAEPFLAVEVEPELLDKAFKPCMNRELYIHADALQVDGQRGGWGRWMGSGKARD
eukprot:352422-Chlamydomonas_euryale.AAC.1